MKKVIAGIIMAIMVLSMGVTAFAAETITEQNGSENIDVKAHAIYVSPDDIYDSSVADGKADITTKNNATVSVDGTELDGLTLNVIEMIKEDREAYLWISGIMNELCDKFTAYDIYFTNQDGNRVNVTNSVTVSITTPDGYKSIQVYHIGLSAKTDEITSKQSGKNTLFTVKGVGYYVLANKVTDNGTTTDPTKPGNSDSPQTGDDSNMKGWIAILIISGGALTVLGASKKRKQLNNR